MATKTKNTEERLDSAHMERVISALDPVEGKPITKKDACAILGIAYNTTRLGALIEKYKEGKARDAKRRADLRGKPATQDEIIYTIQEYLDSGTIDSISRAIFRSPIFVKNILEQHSVPVRSTSHDYFCPELIPESATRDRFTVGEVTYSARYDSTARIDLELFDARHGWIYRIWLLSERWKQSAYQPATELASLQHLRDIGVRV